MSSSSAAAAVQKKFKLYGVPLSQPFRSVAWTMLQLHLSYQIELAVPGLTNNNKIGTQHDDFKSLTPYRNSNVPLLSILFDDNRQEDVVVLSESPAIMMYLCESSSEKTKLYPSTTTTARNGGISLIQKSKIDSYLHWHHDNTRLLSKLFQVKVRPDLTSDINDSLRNKIDDLLYNINNGWLCCHESNKNETTTTTFIGGMETPTIADILMYGEISTVTMTNLLVIDPMKHQNLHRWTQRMEQLPYHDEAHAAVLELGDLNLPTTQQAIQKLLSNATKVGLKSLTDAQQSYTSRL